jgi:DNA uptake protein ComE-like DNA-binding protein
MMARRSPINKIYILLLIFLLAACAPDNLDITPTVAPTAIPIIKVYVTGAVNQPNTTVEIQQGSRVSDAIEAAGGALDTADLSQINQASVVRDGDQVRVPAQGETIEAVATTEATPEAAAANPEQAFLDYLLENMPGTVNAGVISWRRDQNIAPTFVERDGGVTGRVSFTEPGGGLMELTFGIFNSPDSARTYYDSVRGQLRTLDRAEERAIFPTPNAFGGGTYGSDAIFARDNIFLRVSIPRFSSTAGEPLTPAARAVFKIIDDTQASYAASS